MMAGAAGTVATMSETSRPDIQRVGVVGCGQMGAGIAEVSARAGLDTIVHEIDAASAERGRNRLIGSFDKAVARGRMTEEDRDATLATAYVHDRPSRTWPIAAW